MALRLQRPQGSLHPNGEKSPVGRCVQLLAYSLLAGCCVDLPDARLERTYGGVGNDIVYHAIEANDGGFLLAGISDPEGGGPADVSIRKVSDAGQTIFVKSFGGSKADIASYAERAIAGGYVVAGSTESQGSGGSNMYLLRIDDSGTELWSRTFGGERNDAALGVVETDDGGFLLCGYTESVGAGGRDMYLVKTDQFGVLVWERAFGDVGTDSGCAVIKAKDGGYLAVGESDSGGREPLGAYIVKLDNNGDLEWEVRYGGEAGTTQLQAKGVQESIAGDFIVLAESREQFPGGSEIRLAILIAFNAAGTISSVVPLAYPTREIFPRGLDVTPTGGFVVVCNSVERMSRCKKILVAVIDDQLRVAADAELGHLEDDQVFGVHATQSGDYVIAGATTTGSPSGTTDMYLVVTNDADIRRLRGP